MLAKIQALLGLSEGAESGKLQAIVELVMARLLALIGQKEVPAELEYVVVEVAVRRFNRIGSEGLSAHTVEGESQTFSSEDDFEPYLDDIKRWLENNTKTAESVIRFL